MNTLHVLKVARAILEYDDAWTKNVCARSIKNREVMVESKRAVCFCAVGAIMRAGHVAKRSPHNSFDMLERAMDGSISAENDRSDTEQLHVLMAFDFAILMTEDLENA